MLENRNVYIVEGKTDKDKLSKLGFKFFILTEGLHCTEQTLKLTQECLDAGRKVILLADPDDKGQMIRRKFKSQFGDNENYLSILLDKNSCNDGKKIGIANAKMQYLAEELEEYISYEDVEDVKRFVEYDKELEEKLHNSKFREYLVNKYFFQSMTYKSVLNSLKMLKISNEELLDNLHKFEESYGV